MKQKRKASKERKSTE